jgi:hypothetical protein
MSRQTRSPSIPIPRAATSATPGRNIESVISLPLSTSARFRTSTAQSLPQRGNLDDNNGVGSSQAARNPSALSSSASSTRTAARSLGLSSAMPSRAVARPPAATFEPRIIRADSSRTPGNPCIPSTSSTTPARTRKPSAAGGGNGNGRTTNAQRAVPGGVCSPPPVAGAFPRPSYLEHSSLRHLLRTEPSHVLPLTRKSDGHAGTAEAQLPPTRVHSSISPPTDSDEDSNGTPLRDVADVAPTTSIPPSDVVLLLPTRWSDQDRHPSLSISADGREVMFNGSFLPRPRETSPRVADRMRKGPAGASDSQASAARTIHPVPPACGVYYYEVEIVNKGSKGSVSIFFL